jgi:hypothetical protein
MNEIQHEEGAAVLILPLDVQETRRRTFSSRYQLVLLLVLLFHSNP